MAVRYASEQAVIVRCPCCGGLREISGPEYRRKRTGLAICSECARARRPALGLHGWWEARFTAEELRAMGKAIWG